MALEASSPRRTILLVDDEPDILESLRELIEVSLEDVEVLTVESGEEALKTIQSQHVDLIVSDYKMPGMNGLELLIQSRSIAPRVPRIMMTAFPDLDIAIKAINHASIENFFTKPLDPDEILQVIAATLKARQGEAQRHQAFARAMELARRAGRPGQNG